MNIIEQIEKGSKDFYSEHKRNPSIVYMRQEEYEEIKKYRIEPTEKREETMGLKISVCSNDTLLVFDDIICYSCFVDYDEYEIFHDVEDLWKFFINKTDSLRNAYDQDSFYIGYYHTLLGGKKTLRYNKNIYVKRELSEEDYKKIEQDIDKEIEKTEKFLSFIKFPVSGCFPHVTKKTREQAIAQEIINRSYLLNTKLDKSALIYTP